MLGFVLAGVGLMWIVQVLLARTARQREGTEVGPVPEPFDGLVRGDTLLWFHSPSCGPCRAMRGDVEAMQAQGRLHAVDVSRHLDVARAMSVMATPTTVRVRHGRIVEVRTGVMRLEALERMAG